MRIFLSQKSRLRRMARVRWVMPGKQDQRACHGEWSALIREKRPLPPAPRRGMLSAGNIYGVLSELDVAPRQHFSGIRGTRKRRYGCSKDLSEICGILICSLKFVSPILTILNLVNSRPLSQL